jgi:hydrogenase/urease accessory protein HupE
MTRPRLSFDLPFLCALGCFPALAYAHAPGIDKPLPALGEYFQLGFEHILTGYDHLAFLLGLTLLTRRKGAVLWAVTAFTLAHSLSLGLCVMGVVAPPVRWVETAIALSIAYIAVENVLGRNTERRFPISFVFGFVHGFGFAGALQEIGVPADSAPAALALFNLGVEAGQLSVLLVLLPVLDWARQRPALWSQSTRVVHAALFALGLGWAGQRAFAAVPVAAVAPSVESLLASTQRREAPQLAAAEELCELFARMPRVRRAECAGEPVGVTLERACARNLSAAWERGGLRLAPAAQREQCAREQRARFDDCASVERMPAAESCSALWQGELREGASCGSSLECREGLQCAGVGPFDPGVCARPKRAGAACGRSIDPLAGYLPHAEHRECAGECVQGRCRG